MGLDVLQFLSGRCAVYRHARRGEPGQAGRHHGGAHRSHRRDDRAGARAQTGRVIASISPAHSRPSGSPEPFVPIWIRLFARDERLLDQFGATTTHSDHTDVCATPSVTFNASARASWKLAFSGNPREAERTA